MWMFAKPCVVPETRGRNDASPRSTLTAPRGRWENGSFLNKFKAVLISPPLPSFFSLPLVLISLPLFPLFRFVRKTIFTLLLHRRIASEFYGSFLNKNSTALLSSSYFPSSSLLLLPPSRPYFPPSLPPFFVSKQNDIQVVISSSCRV